MYPTVPNYATNNSLTQKADKPNFDFDWVKTDVGGDTDLNHLNKFGVYQINNPQNAPSAGWYTVVVIPFGGDNVQYCRQIAFRISSGNTYTRYCQGGTWGAWGRFALD